MHVLASVPLTGLALLIVEAVRQGARCSQASRGRITPRYHSTRSNIPLAKGASASRNPYLSRCVQCAFQQVGAQLVLHHRVASARDRTHSLLSSYPSTPSSRPSPAFPHPSAQHLRLLATCPAQRSFLHFHCPPKPFHFFPQRPRT